MKKYAIIIAILLFLVGCAVMTIYPKPTNDFLQSPYYQISYDKAWDSVLEVLGEERVGTAYQNREKGKIITGYFTNASEGAHVQKNARWSYVITFVQLPENKIKINVVCKLEQYLKGWGLVAYEWRDITYLSDYKIAHNLEKWLYEKIEKQGMLSIPTNSRSYQDIKGIVLNNGDIVEGQILSMNAETVKIRTKNGKVMSYSFINDIKECKY